MQGGGVFVESLAVSFDAHNVSFARILMYTNGSLSSAAAGGININNNVTTLMQLRVGDV